MFLHMLAKASSTLFFIILKLKQFTYKHASTIRKATSCQKFRPKNLKTDRFILKDCQNRLSMFLDALAKASSTLFFIILKLKQFAYKHASTIRKATSCQKFRPKFLKTDRFILKVCQNRLSMFLHVLAKASSAMFFHNFNVKNMNTHLDRLESNQ